MLDEGDTSETPLLRLAAHRGIPPDVLAQVDPWLATVVKQREPLLISDMIADPRARASIGQVKPLTFFMAPLQAGGRVLGVLGLAESQGVSPSDMAPGSDYYVPPELRGMVFDTPEEAEALGLKFVDYSKTTIPLRDGRPGRAWQGSHRF